MKRTSPCPFVLLLLLCTWTRVLVVTAALGVSTEEPEQQVNAGDVTLRGEPRGALLRDEARESARLSWRHGRPAAGLGARSLPTERQRLCPRGHPAPCPYCCGGPTACV